MKKLSVLLGVVFICFGINFPGLPDLDVDVLAGGDACFNFIRMEDPGEYFWGDPNYWKMEDGSYTGRLETSSLPIYSYTAFDKYNNFNDAVSNKLTNYRVKMVLKRPKFGESFPRVVVGSGNSSASSPTNSLIITVSNSNLVITQFGNNKWNPNNGNTIDWNKMPISEIKVSQEFEFDILVTPSKIELRFNGTIIYSCVPENNQEAGPFGIGNSGNKSLNDDTGVKFKDIEFCLYGSGGESPEDLDISVSPAADPFTFDVKATGAILADSFQVWLKCKRDVDLADNGNFASSLFSWRMVKGFDDTGAEKGVSFADGQYLFTFTVPKEMQTSSGEYEVYVRYRGDLERGLLLESFHDVKESGGALSVSPASGSGSDNDGVGGGGGGPGDLPDRFIFSCDSVLGVSDMVAGGILSVDLKGCNGNGDFKTKKLINGVGGGAGSLLSLALDDNVYFKFRYGEAFRTPLVSTSYSVVGSYNYTVDKPGIYQIWGFVRGRTGNGYDDGLIRSFKVLRGDEGEVTGSGAFDFVKLSVTRDDGAGNDVGVEGFSDLSVLLSGESFDIDPGDLVKLSVGGRGLSSSSSSGDDTGGLYLYSFWRLDAGGYRLVKDWGPEGEVFFRPASPGHYTLQLRVKGVDAGSYEDIRNVRFKVSGFGEIGAVTLELLDDDERLVLNPVSGEEILIKALSSGDGNYVYRFEVWDSFLGNRCLQGFSPDSSVSWVPRKPGIYRVIVRVQDVSSLGFGDFVEVLDVEVG